MIVTSQEDCVIISDREQGWAKISLSYCVIAIAWGVYWLVRGGALGFTLLGLPGVLLFLIPAAEPLIRSRVVKFDGADQMIRMHSKFFSRHAAYHFPFSAFSKIEIREHRTPSRPSQPTFKVRLKRSDSADAGTPEFISLGYTMDEAEAWTVLDSVCEKTGIPIPRDVKHDGPKRRGPKRIRKPKRKQ